MDINEYISSGILEAYVLGALTEEERRDVEAKVTAHPELAVELEAIENAMQHFVEEHAIAPPAHLQNQIWEAIEAAQPAAASTSNTETPTEPKGADVYTIAHQSPRQLHPWRWLWAAAVIVLTGSLLFNFYLMNERNALREEQVAMRQEMDTMKQQHEALAATMQQYSHEKEMMADPSMKSVVMHTMQEGHPMVATVYWSPNKGEGYVSIQKLPAPPTGMQYQLWVMKDNKPVDMGMISNDVVAKSGMEKVQKPMTGTAQAFAITLEKAGGSPTPSMDKVYVMGKIPA
ncbi:anti-sigma factor [Taibaiella soli]|uniref:Regulator of SigK n=1 Tax=Taibaiella soli TaxID=1649169 RepID=A0A2W2ARB1_9BACT|nr:anti-sigma factor [Taibaiella soli]PZF75000.1 hypothetical protein DN068_00145 [Taibaiella soli]